MMLMKKNRLFIVSLAVCLSFIGVITHLFNPSRMFVAAESEAATDSKIMVIVGGRPGYDLNTIDDVNYFSTHVFIGDVISKDEIGDTADDYLVVVSEWLKGSSAENEIHVVAAKESLLVGSVYIMVTDKFQFAYAPHISYCVVAAERSIIEVLQDGTLVGNSEYIGTMKNLEDYLLHVRNSEAVMSVDPRLEVQDNLFPAEEVLANILASKSSEMKDFAKSEAANLSYLLDAQYDASEFVLRAKISSISSISKYLSEARVNIIETYKGEWPDEYIFWVPTGLEPDEYIIYATRPTQGNVIMLSFSQGSLFSQKSAEWNIVSENMLSR